jgi:hypothetical protein
MEYEIERCTRHCATSGRQFAEGEPYYSAVVERQGKLQRLDYAAEAWTGAPAEALAWWTARMPTRPARQDGVATSEVLLELFRQLPPETEQRELRYVLALLMVRRRILRLEDTEHEARGVETLVLYCPRDETTYRVASQPLEPERATAIQQELTRLLFGEQGAAGVPAAP